VPIGLRLRFLPPATCGFATFALAGYYAALVPAFVAGDLHLANPLVGGAIVAGMYATAAAAIVATRALSARAALLGGLVLLLPGAGLLLLAQLTASLTALCAATLFGGSALALGFRGSLAAVNRLAPDAQRAEILSSYMIVCFLGNSLPVIGLAALSQFSGPQVARVVFAAAIVAFATVGGIAGWRDSPADSSSHARAPISQPRRDS
jgi:hypothetical protein